MTKAANAISRLTFSAAVMLSVAAPFFSYAFTEAETLIVLNAL